MNIPEPDQAKPFTEYAHMVLPLSLAGFGAVVRTLTGLREGCSWKRMAIELCINMPAGVFAGAVVGLSLESLDWSYATKCVLIALSGVSGKDLVAQWVTRRWLDTVSKCVLPGPGK